jgi:hypothetical protein
MLLLPSLTQKESSAKAKVNQDKVACTMDVNAAIDIHQHHDHESGAPISTLLLRRHYTSRRPRAST